MGFQQYLIEGYDQITQNLLDLADKLLAVISKRYNL